MTNARRGEVEAILDGKTYRLCLTLGALAELEGAFGVDDLVSFAERLESRRLSARDLLRVIACGLRGGGQELSDEEAARMTAPGGLADYVRIAAELLAATFGEGGGANPPPPQDARD
jgi:hypothetical protein